MNNIYNVSDFNVKDLGSFYSAEQTIFRVFAPDYEQMNLVINNHHYAMHKKGSCFEIALSGDLELVRYHYEIDDDPFKDPFAYMSDENDSYVLNTELFNTEICRPEPLTCEPIIYELSVRDFSSDELYPGTFRKKFLSLAQKDLKIDGYYSAGLDYLKELGITHVQLMPVFDYDDDKSDYNWGYNPIAYNHVKKDYVVEQDNPYAYINELRHTVNVLHQNNIRVTLDCVFNHVYNVRTNDLGKMLNGRLYRYKDNGELAMGTLCGSEIDTDNIFVRSYILEMIERYITLFDIDGIRLDLMGIIDVDTVNAMAELNSLKPDFMVYGEGWNMGDVLSEERRATIDNAARIPQVKMFNDYFREVVIHYVSGNDMIDSEVMKALSGVDTPLAPAQAINYVECHDDYTFYDRLNKYLQYDGDKANKDRCIMALAMVLFSQGTAFIHAGEEFFRTKDGKRNSYNLSDEINRLDWKRRCENSQYVSKVRDLISFRKEHKEFNGAESEIRFTTCNRCLIYQVGNICILFNPSDEQIIFEDGRQFHILFDEYGRCDYVSMIVSVSAHSFVICEE